MNDTDAVLDNQVQPEPAAPNTGRPLSFGEVQTAHEMAKSRDPFFSGMSLQDFSRYMNKATGTESYTAGDTGAVGQFFKGTETGLNYNLAPLAEKSKELGGGIGSLIAGDTGKEIGEGVGESLPRGVATMLPFLAAGATESTPVGWALTGAGLLSAFSEGYTKSNSPLVGAISAGTIPTMGALGNVGGNLAARYLSRPIGDAVGSTFGKGMTGLLERGIEDVGKTIGEAAAMEIGGQASSAVMGNGLYNPFTIKHAAETVAGVLPYKLMDIPTLARGYKLVSGKVEPANLKDMFSSMDDVFRLRSKADMGRPNAQAAVALYNAFQGDVRAQAMSTATTRQRDPGVLSKMELPQDGGEEGQTTEKIGFGMNKKQIMSLLGPSLYSQSISRVAMKELFQNSFDALKEAIYKGHLQQGKIDINVDRDARTISLADNGVGMSPDTVKKAYFTLGGSRKDVPPELRSGGLGIAKMGFMLGSDGIRVETVKDGLKTLVDTTAQQIQDDDINLVTQPTKEPNGTKVTVKIPEHYYDRNGEKQSIEIPWSHDYGYGDILKKFNNPNIKVTYNGKGLTPQIPPLFTKVKFKWGEADVHVGEQPEKYPSHSILSSGIYQFDKTFKKAPNTYENVPFNIVIDVKPHVGTDDPYYPFNNQRENFRPSVQKDIEALEAYLMKMGRAHDESVAAAAFDNIHGMPHVDVEGELSPEEKARLQTVGVLRHSASKISQERPSYVTVDDEGIVDDLGKRIVQKTKDKYGHEKFGPASFEADKDIELNKAKDLSKFNDKDPQYHNNTNVDYLKIPGAGHVFAKLASIMYDSKKWAFENVPGYDKLNPEHGKYFAGVSIDKEYAGVHTNYPFKGIFLNPASIPYDISTTQGIAGYWSHVILHELAHTNQKSEDAGFTSALAHIYGHAEQAGYVDQLKLLLRSVTERHLDTITEIRNQYENSRTQNIAKSFKGESELKTKPPGDVQGDAGSLPSGGAAEGETGRSAGDTGRDSVGQGGDGTAQRDGAAESTDKIGDLLYHKLRVESGESLSKAQIKAHLDNLSKFIVDPEQLAKAGESLSNMHVKKGETFEQALFREAGIDLRKPGSKDDLMKGTQAFYQRLFTLRGYDNESVKRLTDLALSISAKFNHLIGDTKIAESTDASFALGSKDNDPTVGKMIAILRKDRFWKGDELFNFGKLWELGHELTHQVQYLSTPEYLDALNSARLLTSEEKVDVIHSMMRELTGNPEVAKMFIDARSKFYNNTDEGHAEFIADATAAIALGATKPSSAQAMSDWAFFGNKATTSWIGHIAQQLASGFDAVRTLFRGLSGKPKSGIDAFFDNATSILAGKEKADNALSMFFALQNRTTHTVFDDTPTVSYAQIQRLNNRVSGFDSHATAAFWPFRDKTVADKELLKDAGDKMDRPTFGGKRLSLADKFKPIIQLMKDYPEMKDAFELGFAAQSVASEVNQLLWRSFANEKGRINLKSVHEVGETGSRLERAFSDIALKQQDEEGRLFTKDERKEKSKLYASLKPEDQAKLDKVLEAFGQSAVMAAIERVRMHREGISSGIATVLQYKLKYEPDQAMQLGRDITSQVFDEGNPEVNMQAVLTRINSEGLPPEVYSACMDIAAENLKSHQEFKGALLGADGKGKPGYFPEVRIKDWHIGWEDIDGTKHYEDYGSQTEGQKKLDELKDKESRGVVKKVVHFNARDKRAQYYGLQSDMLDAYAKADQVLLNSVLQRLDQSSPEYEQFVQELKESFHPGQGALAEMASPYTRERKKVAGRERLNMAAGMVHYLNATSSGLARQYARQQQSLALNTEGMRSNLNLRANARMYLNSLLDTRGAEFTKLKDLVFFNFLGFNPSSNVIDFTQQALRHAPELMRQGFGAGQVMSEIGKSFLTVGRARLHGEYVDKELQAAVAKAAAEKVIDRGMVSETYNEEDLSRINAKRMADGEKKLLSVGDLLGTPLYHMVKAAKAFYGSTASFNIESAFVSSYALAKRRGLKGDAAYDFAKEATRVSMLGGGIPNRPMILHGWGKLSGVGGLMYNMMSYEAGSIAQMMRYTRESFNKTLAPNERKSAMRAAGLAWGAQAVIGGVMGLPFVNAAVQIIESIFPEAEVRKHMRQTFMSLGQQDQELGQHIASFAMRGAFNMGPLGLGTRFQLGRLLGIDANDSQWDFSQFVGPLGGILQNYTKGVKSLGEGDVSGAIPNFLPTSARGLTKMYLDGGEIRDSRGNLAVEATPAEKTLLSLGFKPRRLADYYEEQSMKLQAEKNVANELQLFHRQLGTQLRGGDIAGVREALIARQRETGNYDVLEGVKRVVEAAQDQSIPVDPTRSGSRANAQSLTQIGQMFERPQVPTEVQRLQQRTQLAAGLAIPGAGVPSSQEYTSAIMVDQLMQKNPTLSRVEALKMVDSYLHPKRTVMGYGRLNF